MAKETATRFVDDLDGGDAHETMRFGLDGHLYEIAVHQKRQEAPYRPGRLRRARSPHQPESPAGQLATRRGRCRTGGAAHPDQSRAFREWAAPKGYEISQRGRIKQDIVDEFHRSAGR